MTQQTGKHQKQIRLNRYLSSCGVGSRRYCEKLILNGKITVNNIRVTQLATTLSDDDVVRLDGLILHPEELIYILLNKPAGVITTLSDPHGRRHIGQLFQNIPFVKPVGRLDMETTGVLLLTNDGELLYRLTHPKFEIERIYKVSVKAHLDKKARESIESGIVIGKDEVAHGEVLSIASRKGYTEIILKLHEGKYREIRRMFAVLGYKVQSLDRVSYAGIKHEGLKRGEWRELSSDELNKLKELCYLKE